MIKPAWKFILTAFVEDVGKVEHCVKATSEEEARDRVRKAYSKKNGGVY